MAAESILMGLATGGASNLLAEWHADKAQQREKELMDYQNQLNKANALDAYRNTVASMKMAGLNPALAQDTNGTVAATVAKGTGAKGENVELDQTLGLLQAQKENIEADTAKKQAEIGNVQADTSKKTAEILFTNAGTDKIKEETQNIKNTNEIYKNTNEQLNPMGQAMAQKWQSTEWYNHLNPESKDWIDSVASGNEKLTVGGMNALHTIINSQKEISDADRTLVKNAFDNAISESMYSDPEIMNAIAKAPLNDQNKIKKEINKLVADTTFTKLKGNDLENRIKSFIETDLGFLAHKGEWGKYMREVLVQKLAGPLATGFAGGGILGIINKFLPKGSKSPKPYKPQTSKSSPLPHSDHSDPSFPGMYIP